MKSLRVVSVERDQKLWSLMWPHYQHFFRDCGYEAVCFPATDETTARRAIAKEWPHIVLCDLGYDEDYAGLILIRNLRRDFPDVFVIGTSRGDYSPRNVQQKQPSFHLFLDKEALITDNKKYLKELRERFLGAFALETEIQVLNFDALKERYFPKPSQQRELMSLLRQVFFLSHSPDELMKPDEITLAPISGGYSGSLVFRIEARNKKSGIVSVPAVLKVSESIYARQEYENYMNFVKWGIPYMWRVDVLGTGLTKHYGAIAYSFVLSDLNKFDALTSFLRDRRDSDVIAALERLFSPELKRWYGDALVRSEGNIAARYSARYFRGEEAKRTSTNRFLKVVQDGFNARVDSNKITIAGRSYKRPAEALFAEPHGDYQSCICHGDLNSNNMLLAENGQVVFIDFQETGRGHVFEDFITMESSIRLYYGESEKVSDYVKVIDEETAVGDGEDISGLSPVYRLISEMRRLARGNFPNEPFYNYLYGVAAFNFRLLRADAISEGQARRCTAAMLGALRLMGRKRGKPN